jgi:hypothetical protein
VIDRLAAVNLLPVSGDGWINIAESSEPLELHALLDGVEDGRSVTLTLKSSSGQTLISRTATVNAGEVSLSIAAADLSWSDGSNVTVDLTGSDAAGNPFSSSRSLSVDLTAPTLATMLQRGTEDPIELAAYGPGGSRANQAINAADLAAGVWITSEASADAMVTSVDAGNSGGLLVAASNGRWRLALDPNRINLPSEGRLPLSITVLDEAGNSATATGSVLIDRGAGITITAPVDGAGGNDQINAQEAPTLRFAGLVQEVEAGASVSVEVVPAAGGSVADGDGSEMS